MAKELRAQLILDISKAKQSIASLQSDFISLAKAAKSDFKTIGDDLDKGIKTASSSTKDFKIQLTNLKDQASILKMELSTIKSQPKIDTASLDTLNNKFINLRDQFGKMVFEPNVNLQKVQIEFSKLNTAIAQNSKIIEKSIQNGAEEGAKKGSLGIKREFTKAGIGQLIQTQIISGLSINAIESAANLAKNTVSNSFGSFLDFEKNFSSLKSIAGATADELDKIRKVSLEVGKTGKASSLEAVQGMEELIKAGRTTEQAIQELPDVLNLAKAGNISMAESAILNATSLNAFSKEGLQSARAANIIAGAANVSAIDVDQLRLSMQQASAVAGIVGLSFKDTATSIALFGNKGLIGSDAGTSLKTMLLNLQPGTAKASAEFDKLGLTVKGSGNKFFDAQGKIKPMVEIVKTLSNATKGMSEEQKLASLEILFGSDAIRAASILASSGADEFNNLAEGIEKISVADVAAEKMNNLKSKIEIISNKTMTSLQEQFIAFEPTLSRFADNLIKVIDRIPEFIKFLQDFQQPLIVAAILMTGLAVATWLFAAGVTTVSTLLGAIAAPFVAIGAALSSPIALIIAGITAIIAIGYLLFANWDIISSKSKEIWDNVTKTITTFKDGAIKTFNELLEFVKNFNLGELINKSLDNLKSGASEQLNSLKDSVSNTFETIKNTATNSFNSLKETAKPLTDGLTVVGDKAKELTGILGLLAIGTDEDKKNASKKLNDDFIKPIQEFSKIAFEIGKQIFNQLIVLPFESTKTTVSNFFTVDIPNYLSTMYTNLITTFENGKNFIIQKFVEISIFLLNLFLIQMPTIVGNGFLFIQNKVQELKNSLALFVSELPGKINFFIEQLKNSFSSLKDTFFEKINQIVNFDYISLGRNIGQGILDGIKNTLGGIGSWFNDQINSLRNSFRSMAGLPAENYTGVRNFKGGLSYLAERGAEIVEYKGVKRLVTAPILSYLPKGSNVYNNEETTKMLSQAGGFANSGVFSNNISNSTTTQSTSNIDNSRKQTNNFNNNLSLDLGFSY